MTTNLHKILTQLLDEDDIDSVKNELMTRNYTIGECGYDSDAEVRFKAGLTTNGITCELVAEYGGEEQGRDYWGVYKFTQGENSVYIKFSGWYASYVGSEYELWEFVTPTEKIVTVYV